MADSLRPYFEGIPNARGARYFPGVTGQFQTRIRGLTIELLKPSGGTAFFIATNADRNYALATQFSRNLKDSLGSGSAELADRVKNPGNLDAFKTSCDVLD